eukprot:3059062-Pleurochrysis_carterae.AAC.1
MLRASFCENKDYASADLSISGTRGLCTLSEMQLPVKRHKHHCYLNFDRNMRCVYLLYDNEHDSFTVVRTCPLAARTVVLQRWKPRHHLHNGASHLTICSLSGNCHGNN